MSYKVGRFLSVMSAGSYKCINIVSELFSSRMLIEMEFCASSVVDQQNAKIRSDVSVSERIHVVEKCQIAQNTKMDSAFVCKRHSDSCGNCAVNSSATDICNRHYAVWQFKECP